ncbi:MAG: methyltransferase family protein [Candidatus Binatia bacterium]
MNQKIRDRLSSGIRTIVTALIVGLFLLNLSATIFTSPQAVAFERWYGNWRAVANVAAIFLLFVFFLTKPRRAAEWQNAGLTTAFFISLFAEMFGVPLTIYLSAPLFGVEPQIFGHMESHLWAYLLSWVGVMNIEPAVYLVMVVSTALITIGFSLLALGWKGVYRAKGELVVTGLYCRLRHPQYLGLILIIIAFLIQWPTLLTLLLAPFLIARYIRLSHLEDDDLLEKFGEEFKQYKKRVPGFISLLQSSA